MQIMNKQNWLFSVLDCISVVHGTHGMIRNFFIAFPLHQKKRKNELTLLYHERFRWNTNGLSTRNPIFHTGLFFWKRRNSFWKEERWFHTTTVDMADSCKLQPERWIRCCCNCGPNLWVSWLYPRSGHAFMHFSKRPRRSSHLTISTMIWSDFSIQCLRTDLWTPLIHWLRNGRISTIKWHYQLTCHNVAIHCSYLTWERSIRPHARLEWFNLPISWPLCSPLFRATFSKLCM